jgi:streptogramin lyase
MSTTLRRTPTFAVILTALVACLVLAGQASASTVAPGYAVSDYAVGFPGALGSFGPIGLSFDPSGNLWVMHTNGTIYKVAPGGGAIVPVGQALAEGAGIAWRNGSLYVSYPWLDSIDAIDPATAQIQRTAALQVGFDMGVTTDRFSTDLFFGTSTNLGGLAGIDRVANLDLGPAVTTHLTTLPDYVDGDTMAPDGTIYAAGGGWWLYKIAGPSSATPGAWQRLAVVPGVDGLGVEVDASGHQFVWANDNYGNISRIDSDTGAIETIVSGGSRGDFAIVGPDGCFYATQSTSIVRVSKADGTCSMSPEPIVSSHMGAGVNVLSSGKVTGGVLKAANGGSGGFNVQSDGKTLKGQLQFSGPSGSVHASVFKTLTISADRRVATFSGVTTDGRQFQAYVEDNGEPGRDDVFRLWVADAEISGPKVGEAGGNIQIHK